MTTPQHVHTCCSTTHHTIVAFLFLISLIFLCFPRPVNARTPIKQTTLPDGVEYWRRADTGTTKPWFWEQIEKLVNVIFGKTDALPFKKSTAFLVGVGKYKYLDKLAFVDTDLDAMRTYLLGKGGFDEVYVVRDSVVTARLVKKYMQMKFKKELGTESRLLFYYSGHGDDFGGNTGYMQFCEAKSGDSLDHVLEINKCEEWSQMIRAKHILFIFDCCVSGLAFSPKGDAEGHLKLAGTLSGNGSRIVLTAGTADEKSYGMKGRSIFTKSLLDALENTSYKNDGLLTIDQAFGECKARVAGFTTRTGKKMTPRKWEISVSGKNYNGTFIFIDPLIGNKDFVAAYSRSLPIEKGDEEEITVVTQQLTSTIVTEVETAGTLFLDDREIAQVPRESITELKDIVVGTYTLSVKYEDTYTESRTVEVKHNETTTITFTYVPPPELMVLVEGGSFRMGSDTGYDDEKPVHTVTIDSFYISKYEVTQEEYLRFCEKTNIHYPSWLEPGSNFNIHTGTNDHYVKFAGLRKETHPVVGVSLYDAVAYCNWLSEGGGLEPCYRGRGESITCDFTVNGYRLPTEAEWEYAARGGAKSKGYIYSGSNDPGDVARNVRSASRYYVPPGSPTRSNGFRLARSQNR
jgi:formylglycine-generating enzyme required for sulfatase activity